MIDNNTDDKSDQLVQVYNSVFLMKWLYPEATL